LFRSSRRLSDRSCPNAQAQTAPSTTTTSGQAQRVQITGGTVAGTAAFFSTIQNQLGSTPNAPVLFDATVNSLQLQTTSGNTNTATFKPQAASFKDTGAGNVGTPGAGDEATLLGGLSGIASTSNGFLVPFTNVPTRIDFKLNSFTTDAFLTGSLITPKVAGNAPPVFLPVAPITLSTQSQTNFNSRSGFLQVGPYNGQLTSGSIALPPTVRFGAGTGTTPNVPPVVLGQRTKFEIEGKGFGTLTNTFAEQPSTTSTATAAQAAPLAGQAPQLTQPQLAHDCGTGTTTGTTQRHHTGGQAPPLAATQAHGTPQLAHTGDRHHN
jgi:hypothetical protein